jgi:hypothetical protein
MFNNTVCYLGLYIGELQDDQDKLIPKEAMGKVYDQYNSNKSPTRCNNFPVYYPDVHLKLNMFRAFSRSSSGAQ